MFSLDAVERKLSYALIRHRALLRVTSDQGLRKLQFCLRLRKTDLPNLIKEPDSRKSI